MKSSWLPTLEVSHRYLQVRKAGWDVLFGASHLSFPSFHFPSPPTVVMGAILHPLSPARVSRQYLERFWGSQRGVGDASISWGETGDAAKHLTMGGTAPGTKM